MVPDTIVIVKIRSLIRALCEQLLSDRSFSHLQLQGGVPRRRVAFGLRRAFGQSASYLDS